MAPVMPDGANNVVYVIGNADNRLVKIGTTGVSSLARLAGIQTMSPSILTVLWTTPGDQTLEHQLHYRFRAERRHGEWFDFGDRDPVAEVDKAVAEINGAPNPATGGTPKGFGTNDDPWSGLMGAARSILESEDPAEDFSDPVQDLFCRLQLLHVGQAVLDLSQTAYARAIAHAHGGCQAQWLKAAHTLMAAKQALIGEPPTTMLPTGPFALADVLAMRESAERLADRIEADPYALPDPSFCADLLDQIAGLMSASQRLITMTKHAVMESALRREIPRGSWSGMSGRVDNCMGSLDEASKTIRVLEHLIRGIPSQGWRPTAEPFAALGDALRGRGLDARQYEFAWHFTYAYTTCSIGRNELRQWEVFYQDPAQQEVAWICAKGGRAVDGLYLPDQIVLWALGCLNREIGGPTHVLAPRTVDVWDWSTELEEGDAPTMAEDFDALIAEFRTVTPSRHDGKQDADGGGEAE